MVYCGCGERMQHSAGGGYQGRYGHWRCPARVFGKACDNLGISDMMLLVELQRQFAGLRLTDQQVEQAIAWVRALAESASQASDLAQAERELARLVAARGRLLDDREAGLLTQAELAERLPRLRRDLAEAEARVNAARAEAGVDLEERLEWAVGWLRELRDLPEPELARVLPRVAERITVYERDSQGQMRQVKLSDRPVWKAGYKKRMRQMRARWWTMKDTFPDALKGVEGREYIEDDVTARASGAVEVLLAEDVMPRVAFTYERLWDEQSSMERLKREDHERFLHEQLRTAERRVGLDADLSYHAHRLIDGETTGYPERFTAWLRELLRGTVPKAWPDDLVKRLIGLIGQEDINGTDIGLAGLAAQGGVQLAN